MKKNRLFLVALLAVLVSCAIINEEESTVDSYLGTWNREAPIPIGRENPVYYDTVYIFDTTTFEYSWYAEGTTDMKYSWKGPLEVIDGDLFKITYENAYYENDNTYSLVENPTVKFLELNIEGDKLYIRESFSQDGGFQANPTTYIK